MPVDPVMLSAKFRDPRRVKRRFVSEHEAVRRARAALRAYREDGFDRPRVRDASSGAFAGSVTIPGRTAHPTASAIHLHLGALTVKMPVDPAMTAAHERTLGEEAASRAKDAELDAAPGLRGKARRGWRLVKQYGGKLFFPALILIDRLNLGLNLNTCGAALWGILRWLKP